MLILTRRAQESIRLGSRIRLTVLGFKGNQVRIGIEAPLEVPVDREEVWERKQQEARSGRKNQPATTGRAPLPDALPTSGSMPPLHEKARIP